MHKATNGTQQEWALFVVQGIAVWHQSTLSWGEIKEAYGVNPQTKKIHKKLFTEIPETTFTLISENL